MSSQPSLQPATCTRCARHKCHGTVTLLAVQDLARRTDNALTELSTLDKDVKLARQLIADITKAGMEIYEGLAKEGSLKEARQRAIATQADKSDVQQAIQVGV
jgi:Clusterin-associated protein-1